LPFLEKYFLAMCARESATLRARSWLENERRKKVEMQRGLPW
jgi:hypothetical protein